MPSLVGLPLQPSNKTTMPPARKGIAGTTTTTTTTASAARPPRKSYVFDASLDVPSPGGPGFGRPVGIGRGKIGHGGAGPMGGSVVTESGMRRSSRLSSGSETSQATPPPATSSKRKGKAAEAGADQEARDRLAMPPPPVPSSSSALRQELGVNGSATSETLMNIPDASVDSNALGSFDFTTQPFPTPGAASKKDANAKRKRVDAAAAPAGNVGGRNKRAKIPADESGEGSTPKSVHLYGSKDWNDDLETSLIISETPMQNKNRDFRRGPADLLSTLGLGVPGAGGSGSRRQSMERRGGRGSSIGNGFEATPHPTIDSSEFHRHINLSQPPAVRLRALVSWCAQRASVPTTSSSLPGAAHLVRKALDGVVKGVCESRIDVSWYGGPPAPPTTLPGGGKGLPPHPQNIKNEKKMAELDLWESTMTREDGARQELLQRYRAFAASADSSLESLSSLVPPSADASTSTTAKLSFSVPDLPLPASSALGDIQVALAYGRRIRTNPVPAGWGESAAEEAARKDRRKSKGKGRASVATATAVEDGDTIDVAQVVGAKWSDIRSNTAALFSHAHELDQACRVAQTYTSQRLTAAHAALSGLSQPAATAAAPSSTGPTNGPGAVAPVHGGDARDLLRAIAREDTKKGRR